MVMDGPMNRDAFEAYIEQNLIPGLKAGEIVVLDNLSNHKTEKSQESLGRHWIPTLVLTTI